MKIIDVITSRYLLVFPEISKKKFRKYKISRKFTTLAVDTWIT